jgi:conjugative transfer signal peptidase TraF
MQAVAALAGAALLCTCEVNTSGSLPRGMYLRVPRSWAGRLPARGDLVLACAPVAGAAFARRRGYLGAGLCDAGGAGRAEAIGKMVLAVAGDEIALGDDGIEVNGRRVAGSRPLAVDRMGRPLAPFLRGCLRLGPGEVWLYAPHPRSYDSRYFGPVGDGGVLAFLVPVAIGDGGSGAVQLVPFHLSIVAGGVGQVSAVAGEVGQVSAAASGTGR